MRPEIASRGRLALLIPQHFPNLRERGLSGGFTDSHKIIGVGEVIPHERLHVWLDDHVSLLPPSQIRVALNDGERATDHVRGRARLLEAAGLEIYRDDDVRAQEQSTFDRNRRGEEAIDQSAILKLNRDE